MLCYAWENSPIHKVVKSLQLNDLCFVFGVLVPTTYFSQLTGTKRKTYRLEIQYIVKYGNRDGETFSSTPLEDEDIVEEENDDYDF